MFDLFGYTIDCRYNPGHYFIITFLTLFSFISHLTPFYYLNNGPTEEDKNNFYWKWFNFLIVYQSLLKIVIL